MVKTSASYALDIGSIPFQNNKYKILTYNIYWYRI